MNADFLVIGSGIAGLMFALEVAHLGKVIVLTKTEPSESSTRYAQGGIASVTSPADSIEAHVQDTLEAGAGLCNEAVVRQVVSRGPECIARLVELGARFDTSKDSGDFSLGREGGHSERRILHWKDSTGAQIHQSVYKAATAHPNISVLSHHLAIDLIVSETKGNKEVIGVYAYDQGNGQVVSFAARVTVLATGGIGKAYLYTSNPDVSTGDGIAMAYRAGARIANMEFIQFHPTCLYHPRAKSFLLSEALRGEGGTLLNSEGTRFMSYYDSREELAPRDIVARAIDHEMKKTGADNVFLDLTSLEPKFINERFPFICERTKELGFDIAREPVPVVPAAHYCCGGVLTNENGKTNLSRLYCIGEAACTGLHGANRLASNSLLEAVVFARLAAKDAALLTKDIPVPERVPVWDSSNATESEEEVIISHTWDEVRRIMWNLVGIVRSDRRLDFAMRRLKSIRSEIQEYYWHYFVSGDLLELRNIIDIADLIVSSARERRESRGLHFNLDCPYSVESLASTNTILERKSFN